MRRGMIYGIALWAILTLGFKLAVDGDFATLSGDQLQLGLPIAGGVIAVAVGIFIRIAGELSTATRFGLGLAAAGMLLGSATLLAFGRFVARPSLEHGVVYALFILWTYGLILLVVAMTSRTADYG